MADHAPKAAKDKEHGVKPAPSRKKLLVAGAASAGMLVCGVLGWYLMTPPAPSDADRLKEAVALVEKGEAAAALELAEDLKKRGYEDPEFPATVPYVLGVATYQVAAELPPAERAAKYAQALTHLREAAKRSEKMLEHPIWLLATGSSLEGLGDPFPARRCAEELTKLDSPQFVDGVALLVRVTLLPGVETAELVTAAAAANAKVLARPDLTDDQKLQATLDKALLHLRRNELEACEGVLKVVHPPEEKADQVLLLEARLAIARRQFEGIDQRLEALLAEDYPRPAATSEALLLLGLAQRALLDKETRSDRQEIHRDRAIGYFRQSITRFGESEESLLSRMELADILRTVGSSEKALNYYGEVLQVFQPSGYYRNRWIGKLECRERIERAWREWVAHRHFREAMALAELMSPLVPLNQAMDMAVEVADRWAQETQRQYESAKILDRPALELERRRRWWESGEAYSRLATAHGTHHEQADALWKSQLHFHRAKDPQAALAQLNRFLELDVGPMKGTALVQKSRLLLDLDDVKGAKEALARVIAEHPTDPAAFGASFLLGTCALEENDWEAAAAAWESILKSDDLAPAATEWRQSLLRLGQLETELSQRRQDEASKKQGAERTALLDAAYRVQEQSVARLTEYLARYPDAADFDEARFSLARALRQQGTLLQDRLGEAETESARKRRATQVATLFEQSYEHVRQVREALQKRQSLDQIDLIGQEMLKSASFETAHSLVRLGRDADAIAQYNTAINRYPNDPQILTAFTQMANAYNRLGKAAEAQSVLEQARVLLEQRQIADASLPPGPNRLTRAEWESWLGRMIELNQSSP